MSFTKGPWRVGADLIGICLDYRDENGNMSKDSFVSANGWAKTVCRINHSQYIKDQSEANASLIAASPLMYEMLERLEKYHLDASCSTAVQNLLAKARGET